MDFEEMDYNEVLRDLESKPIESIVNIYNALFNFNVLDDSFETKIESPIFEKEDFYTEFQDAISDGTLDELIEMLWYSSRKNLFHPKDNWWWYESSKVKKKSLLGDIVSGSSVSSLPFTLEDLAQTIVDNNFEEYDYYS